VWHIRAQVLGLTWGHVSSSVLQVPPIDVVLAADCFYDPNGTCHVERTFLDEASARTHSLDGLGADFESVLASVALVQLANPAARFVTTYHQRSASRNLRPLLDRWRMRATEVPLSSFIASPTRLAELDATVQLFIITLASAQ